MSILREARSRITKLIDENSYPLHRITEIVVDACAVLENYEIVDWINSTNIYEILNAQLSRRYRSVRTREVLVSNTMDAISEIIENTGFEDYENINYAAKFTQCCLNNFRGFLGSKYVGLDESTVDVCLSASFDVFIDVDREDTTHRRFANLWAEQFKVALNSSIFDKFVKISNPSVARFFEEFIESRAGYTTNTYDSDRVIIARSLIEKNPKILSARLFGELHDWAMQDKRIKLPRRLYRDPEYDLTHAFSDLSFVFQKDNKRKHEIIFDDDEPDAKQVKLESKLKGLGFK